MHSLDMSGKNTGPPNNLSSYKRNSHSNANANMRTHEAEYYYGSPIYNDFSQGQFNNYEIRNKALQQLNRERNLAKASLANYEKRNVPNKRRSTRKNRRNSRKARKSRRVQQGGEPTFKEAALQAMKDNGYSDLENFLKKGGFFTNTGDQEVSITGKDGIIYTFKVKGHVNIFVYAKKEGIEYQQIGFVSDH